MNHQHTSPTLTGPHRKFSEGIVSGLSRSAAYRSAFPSANETSARAGGSRLFRKAHIQSEIARLRGKADAMAGSAVLSHLEMQIFLARMVRARRGLPDEDSDLGKRMGADGTDKGILARDKLHAIKLAADLALRTEDPQRSAEAEELAAFHEVIRRVRTKPWRPGEIGETHAQAGASDLSDLSDLSDRSVSSAECRRATETGPTHPGPQAPAQIDTRFAELYEAPLQPADGRSWTLGTGVWDPPVRVPRRRPGPYRPVIGKYTGY